MPTFWHPDKSDSLQRCPYSISDITAFQHYSKWVNSWNEKYFPCPTFRRYNKMKQKLTVQIMIPVLLEQSDLLNYLCVYVDMCTCVPVYLCICVYIYVYIYIYIGHTWHSRVNCQYTPCEHQQVQCSQASPTSWRHKAGTTATIQWKGNRRLRTCQNLS